MQRHEMSFVLDATPTEVWSLLWPPAPKLPSDEIETRVFEKVRIEILHQGDEHHEGLVRHCYYPMPKFLLSGGVAESWELITDVVPGVSSGYRAITRPPFAFAEGTQHLEGLPDGRTRMTVTETYAIKNRLLRLFLEGYLHRFISRDNDHLLRSGLERGVAYLRSRENQTTP
jgi:hypothetical protein